ncbi:unnamed protein product [Miscanthus lutarioriparius]|uniref:Uncharacterized protein n=1 Tax=Miscanthus lutarioriparius TaxID=422564 RepID=A0A811MP71_9POAL|nr:unnamed protein product [Miscanthus lutarioriparius]
MAFSYGWHLEPHSGAHPRLLRRWQRRRPIRGREHGLGHVHGVIRGCLVVVRNDASRALRPRRQRVVGRRRGHRRCLGLSPLPSLDSTLSALLEEEDPPVPDTELLLPIDYQFAVAAAGDEPQPEQQFAQVPVVLPVAGAAEHPGLQTQMSSTASELLHVASSGYTDECFAAAMAARGGYVGLDEALCQQQPPQPGALLPASMMETAAQGCYFGKDTVAKAGGGFFGTGCSGMMMSMMGMEEIGEYQRMMESASAALAATHSPDADSAAAPPRRSRWRSAATPPGKCR